MRKFCSGRTLFTNVLRFPACHTLSVIINCSFVKLIKLTVKPNVAHGVTAGRLSSVHWKDILDLHCTGRVTVAAYRCIEEDNFM